MLRRYRFLIQPRWLVLTAVVLVAMPLFSVASAWQFSRLADIRQSNAQIRSNEAAATVDISDLAGNSGRISAADEWRSVSATGVFAGPDVLVRRKSFEQQTGYWVVSRLDRIEGADVLIVRGWIPSGRDARTAPAWQPAPPGQVTVEGRARTSPVRGGAAPTDLPAGQVDDLYPVEIAARLGLTPGVELVDGFVELTDVMPTPPVVGDAFAPLPLEPPSLSERNHWSYAWQWRAFMVLAIVGWVILVRAQAQRDAVTAPE